MTKINKSLLRAGNRIRLKVHLMGGWKGTGTVTQDQGVDSNLVIFRKDGDPDNMCFNRCVAGREEVSKMRLYKPIFLGVDRFAKMLDDSCNPSVIEQVLLKSQP